MTWKNEFRPAVLKQGYTFYQDNTITIRHFRQNTSDALVRDGKNKYYVTAKLDERGGFRYTCTCPPALHGGRCLHMAALMYSWESEDDSPLKEQNEEAAELFEPHRFDNCFFNPAKALENCTITADSIKKAKALVKSGEVQLDSITHGFFTQRFKENEQILKIYARAKNENDEPVSITIVLGRDNIVRAQCDMCGSYISEWYRPASLSICPHLLAAFLLTGDYILNVNPGDETNIYGQRILDQFSKIRVQDTVIKENEQRADVHLEPRLAEKGDGLTLSFRIGNNKMYVLKDITDLKEFVDQKKSMKLGKNNEVDFMTETFADDSMDLFHFLEHRIQESRNIQKLINKHAYYSGPDMMPHGYIELSGQALDEFYDLCSGEVIDFNGEMYGSFTSLTIGEIPYVYPLTISRLMINGTFEGVELYGDPLKLLSGASAQYFIQDGFLSRLSAEDQHILQPFIDQAGNKALDIRIGRKNLAEFYYRVLPALRRTPLFLINEEDKELIAANLPPEASFSFYLDVDSAIVTCRALVKYGDEERLLGSNETGIAFESFRDQRQERTTRQTLNKYFPYYNETFGGYYTTRDPDVIYDLLEHGLSELMAIGEVHGSDAFLRLRIRRTPEIRIGVSVESTLMDLEILTQDLTSEQLLAILSSYRQKKKYHRLSDDEFISLEQNETLDSLTKLMESMNISLRTFVEGKLHLPLYRALYVNVMLEEHEALAAERDKTFRNLVRSFNTIKDSEYDVPAECAKWLRSYQEYGFKWMHTLSDLGFGGILADDMGLGKTLQSIALIKAAKEEGKLNEPALIVCPTSVVYNWEEEFHKFTPSLKVRTITGTPAERKKHLEDGGCDVLITSYDLLKRDIGSYEDKRFSYQIIDEAQNIKNPKAAASKTVRLIHSEHRFALTGTPIENRLSELWSIFDFLMPGFLYSYENFRSWYETPIAKSRDEHVTEQLRKMVSPFILRRLKGDVLKDLPDKVEEIRYARFSEKQQQLYDGQVTRMKTLLNSLDGNSGESKILVLAELTKIRQICCDPSLLVEGYKGESAKREACLDLIDSAMEGGHKMLIFSQFKSMLELLEEDLRKRKVPYYKIVGETSKEDRMKYVHQFNEDDTPVFLISLKAGGTGLNLTGADMVIHYDPWWNIAAQNQATDRAHRIGQTRNVNVYRLIIKDSVEERILEMQEAKKDLADAILSGEHTSITSLSKEELLELLG